jgi:hypothetical protein
MTRPTPAARQVVGEVPFDASWLALRVRHVAVPQHR